MVIEINYVSELPLEKLQYVLDRGANIEGICITSEIGHVVRYSVDDYKKIYLKLNELIEGIDDNWSNAKKFVMIYKRMTENIEYDYIAAYPNTLSVKDKIYAKKEVVNCRGLKNGLLFGKCVCQGYSEIMRNACSLKGVRAVEIDGKRHSWNQVEIDSNKWIEIDATWGCEKPIEYIGKNKTEFWKEHGLDEGHLFEKENVVINFDLAEFINSEFGINASWYSKDEEKKFIDLIEKRDIYKQDIKAELSELMVDINKRKEFEEQCGYNIKKLIEFGFSADEIETTIQYKYDPKTGEEIDRKKIVDDMVEQRKIKIKALEKECGHTIDELRQMGFKEGEINVLQDVNYFSMTGEKINKKEIVEEKAKLLRNNEGELTIEGKKQMIKYLARDLRPTVAKEINELILEDSITYEEACEIIKFKQGKSDIETVKKIQKRMFKRINEKFDQEFERECGYTIEKLRELGFSNREISEMEKKYDIYLGTVLNRKKIVERKIKEKEKQKRLLLKPRERKFNSRITELITEEKYGEFTPVIQEYLSRALNEYNLSPEFVDVFTNNCKTVKVGKMSEQLDGDMEQCSISKQKIIISDKIVKDAKDKKTDKAYEYISHILNHEIMDVLLQDIPNVGNTLTEAIAETASLKTSFGKDEEKIKKYKEEIPGYGNITFGVNILATAMGVSEKEFLQLAFEHKINDVLEKQLGSKDTAYSFLYEINKNLENIEKATFDKKYTKKEQEDIKKDAYHAIYVKRKGTFKTKNYKHKK